VLFRSFFWISNLCFLLIAYIGFLPYLGSTFFSDLIAGDLPFDIFLPFLGLIGTPTISTVSRGISNFNKKKSAKISNQKFDLPDPTIARALSEAEISELKSLPNSEIRGLKLLEISSPSPVHESRPTDWLVDSIAEARENNPKFSLAKLFFGIEAPLLLLCLLRLFWLHELTPVSTIVLLTALVCVASYTYRWLHPEQAESGSMAWLQMAGHSLMLLLGSYVGVLCLFFIIPGIYWGGTILVYSLFFPPLIPLAIAILALLIMPLGLSIAYIQAWRGFYRKFATKHGALRAKGVTIAVLSVWAIAFATMQIQPQNQAFALLNQSGDPAKRQELLKRSSEIREGLLNAYLSRYRYPNISEEDRTIEILYDSLRLPTEFMDRVQNAYNFMLSPFVYKGSVKDSVEAETLYAQFFDRPILRAELPAIQQAINATFNRAEAKADLLTVNQKKVWLSQQEISIKEHGDWSDVELHEVYSNRTSDRQEIFYAFSLPESAVLTGVWLGDTDNRADSFPFQVSTRGAAQKVYNAEVQKRVDPALLEQVGPSSYRLRVFPILPQFARDSSGKQPLMHMWMTYKVLSKTNGWPLPQLAERRNIFWNKNTKRTLNGQSIAFKEDAWFQSELIPSASGNIQPQLHEVNLPSGEHLIAKPLSDRDYQLPKGKRFAIVLDGSRSMDRKSTQTAIDWLINNAEKDNDLDLYVTASAGDKPKRIDRLEYLSKLKASPFYGLLRPQEILEQFNQIRGDIAYDAVIVLTDEGNYELTDEKAVISKLPAPLWMVHLGQGLPAAYDDATLEAIQSTGGGVSTHVEEVMRRIATQTALKPAVKNVVDDYAWSLAKVSTVDNADNPAAKPTTNAKEDSFIPLAARQLVRELSQSSGTKQLSELDAIHALAKHYNIVTPYSSMIVLVNDEQRQALKNAENQSDRFNRTVEDNQLPQPAANAGLPVVSGVPEPSEWLLIGIVAIALLLIAMRSAPRSIFIKERNL
jgi:putative PEP-CTERM system integral membrane protein